MGVTTRTSFSEEITDALADVCVGLTSLLKSGPRGGQKKCALLEPIKEDSSWDEEITASELRGDWPSIREQLSHGVVYMVTYDGMPHAIVSPHPDWLNEVEEEETVQLIDDEPINKEVELTDGFDIMVMGFRVGRFEPDPSFVDRVIEREDALEKLKEALEVFAI